MDDLYNAIRPFLPYLLMGVAAIVVFYGVYSLSKKFHLLDEGHSHQGHGEGTRPPKVRVIDLSGVNKELNRILKQEGEINGKLAEIKNSQVEFRNEIRRQLADLREKLAQIRALLPSTPTPVASLSDLQDNTTLGREQAPVSDVPAAGVIAVPHPQAPENLPPPPINAAERSRQALESLVREYNESPNELKRRFEVREFTVSNMQAMGKEQGVKPVYCLVEPGRQGEYWLISMDDGASYAVPRPKPAYNLGQFRSAGMDRVFTCNGFIEGQRYRKAEVVKPARFREIGRDELEIVEQGILELGQGEKEPY